MAGQANLVAGVAFFVQLLVAPITVNANGRRADQLPCGGAANPAKRADSSCVVCTRLWRNCALTVAVQRPATMFRPPKCTAASIPSRASCSSSPASGSRRNSPCAGCRRTKRTTSCPSRSSRLQSAVPIKPLLPATNIFTSDFLLLSTLAIMRSDSQRKQLREKTQMPYSYYTFHGGYFRAGICSQATPDIRLEVAAYFIPQWR